MLNRLPPQRLGYVGTLAQYLCLALLALFVAWQCARSVVLVSVDMTTNVSGTMRMQWREQGGAYSDFKAKSIKVKPGRQGYLLVLWSLAELDQLRMQPLDTPGEVVLHSAIVRTLGYDRLVIDTAEHVQVLKQLEIVQCAAQALCLRSLGTQPQLELTLQRSQINTKNAPLIDQVNLIWSLMAWAVILVLGLAFPLMRLPAILLSLVVAGFFCNAFRYDYAVLSLDMQTTENSYVAVYWAATGMPYEEQRARRVDTHAGQHAYRLGMGDFRGIQCIRVDPMADKGKVVIRAIDISAFGFETLHLNAANQFAGVDFASNPDLHRVGDTLEFSTTSNDPYFEIALQPEDLKIRYTLELLVAGLAVLIVMSVMGLLAGYCRMPQAGTLRVIQLRLGLGVLSIMLLQWLWPMQLDMGVYFFSVKPLCVLAAALLVAGFYYRSLHAYLVYGLVFLGMLYGLSYQSPHAVITLELTTVADSEIGVYWAEKAQAYQELKSAHRKTMVGTRLYKLDVGDLAGMHSLRIDPHGVAEFKAITLVQPGYAPVRLNASNQFYAVVKQDNPRLTETNGALVFTAQQADAFFEVNLDPESLQLRPILSWYACLLALLLFMSLLCYVTRGFYPAYHPTVCRVNKQLGWLVIASMLLHAVGGVAWLANASVMYIKLILVLLAASLVAGFYFNRLQLYTLYFLVWLGLLYNFDNFQIPQQHATLALEMQSTADSELAVYWANKFEPYQEAKVTRLKTQAGSHVYYLPIDRLRDVYSLRIDPLSTPGEVLIKSISINELGYDTIRLDARNRFYAVALHKNPGLRLKPEGLAFTAAQTDAFFELELTAYDFKSTFTLAVMLGIVLLLTLINALGRWFTGHSPQRSTP